MRRLLFFASILSVIGIFTAPALAEKRVALVMLSPDLFEPIALPARHREVD